ncbi:hypothetical protein [uncultured Desulfosarcina sp.]|uniref:hypothetical protein n=1 Tax=uncultured Desulfosarcina sp. TaxID=218289 RepID=UPI0029C64547|nr:hypothetical protein [uncultured Desulfosarcina sp.]
MKRNVLLVEPGYKTKFPPMGLMKISKYHKILGDSVYFVKGINHEVPYERYWDRIYVSTLFTYNWAATVKTIKYYKNLVRGDNSRIFVGGIMATLMPEELWKETGLVPIRGLLCEPGMLNDDNEIVINDLVPDYDLFNSTPYEYSLIDDSYFGYSTRGCIRKCKFCGVPTLEPKFIDYWGIKPYINEIIRDYEEKVHLVLFDNNILASKKFEQVINDLIDLGFEKGAQYYYKNKAGQTIHKNRHVDFNQGTDARLMKKSNMELLAKIAINPLRIAFDHIKDKEIYESRIRMAADAGIIHLSNYVLYNYDDTPEDLWERLNININLNQELNLQIYSFPMKFIPLSHKDRTFINEPNWNWQYLRGVQRILNVLKGTVMTTSDFFYRAFGGDSKEFVRILHMPEQILMNRGSEPGPDEKAWTNKFENLTANEKKELLAILCDNKKQSQLYQTYTELKNKNIKEILEYYINDELLNDQDNYLFQEAN